MNILVTGGAGYVGAILIPKLLKHGHNVKILDLYIFGEDVLSSVANNPNIEQIKGDIRDTSLVRKSLYGIDTVIHLACISNDPSFELDPTLGKSINYDATLNLIDESRISGVTRFIYASSSSVYGVKKEREVTEALSLEPLTDYSKFKALCEEYLLQHSGSMVSVVLRPATVCGWSPRLRLDLTVNILTISALVNKKIIVHGGSQMRPNIHIQDIADCYVNFLTYPNRLIDGKIYNVGYENYSLIDIAHMVKKVINDSSVTIEVTSTNDSRSYRVSSKKILRELGFSPTHSLEDAIRDIARAYKKGLIPNALTDSRYYNIKVMQAHRVR